MNHPESCPSNSIYPEGGKTATISQTRITLQELAFKNQFLNYERSKTFFNFLFVFNIFQQKKIQQNPNM